MIEWIIQIVLRIKDFFAKRESVEAYAATSVSADEARKDPTVQRFLKKHKLEIPLEKRKCPVCPEPMYAAPGQIMLAHAHCRKDFRRRAHKQGLLKYRFAANRPRA